MHTQDTALTPIRFPEANTSFGAPMGWDKESDGECGALPLWKIEHTVGEDGETISCIPRLVSCWRLPKMGFWQRLRFAFSGRIWLTVIGGGHPPVSLSTQCDYHKE